MGYEVLKEMPLSVEKMSNLDGIIWAVAPEYENASLFLGGLEKLNDFDSCTGVWLDRLGQLVCLTRQQAGAMIGSRELADDDNKLFWCLGYIGALCALDATDFDSWFIYCLTVVESALNACEIKNTPDERKNLLALGLAARTFNFSANPVTKQRSCFSRCSTTIWTARTSMRTRSCRAWSKSWKPCCAATCTQSTRQP